MVDGRRGDYILFSCTRPEYFKRRACHYSLAKGMKDGLVQIPVDRSFQNHGKKKRARGRIAHAAPALTRQPEDNVQIRAGRGFASPQTEDPCCFLCGGTTNSKTNKIVFCDVCDMGYHQKCVVPVLTKIPAGEWNCFDECKCMRSLRDG